MWNPMEYVGVIETAWKLKAVVREGFENLSKVLQAYPYAEQPGKAVKSGLYKGHAFAI